MPKQTPKNVRSRSSSMTISMLYFHSVVDHCVQNSLRTPIHRTDISMHKSRRCVKAAENGRVYFATNFKAFSIYKYMHKNDSVCVPHVRQQCPRCLCLPSFYIIIFLRYRTLGHGEKRQCRQYGANKLVFSQNILFFLFS